MALDRRRMALVGSTAFLASDAVRTAVYGSTVTRYRGSGKDLDIVVRLQESDRRSLDQVGRVPVTSMTGAPVPLRNFAEVASGFSPISIDHSSQRRVLRVGANLTGSSLGDMTAAYEGKSSSLRSKFPELVFRYGGQAKEQQENFVDLMAMLALGIFLTYLIMAAQFESFLDPLVIMFSVPFAFTGTFLALAIRGENFNVLAFLGAIMLVGIVVNNAIVLVDYVNFMRREGTPLIEAVVETSRRRLRPILMTTITTLFGIIPLAVASGEGSELWRPIGITMLGGLSLSTGVTLVLVPCLYVTFDRFRSKGRFERDRVLGDLGTAATPSEGAQQT
jgi:HAE1 family hydrophobic/amphiphilic exporter-1